MSPRAESATRAGWTHLQDGRWDEAEASFKAALSDGPSPEALEGLSWAAWWLDRDETVFEAREEAFRLYRDERRHAAAARMAIWLAADHLDFKGAVPVARGWLRRAARLLDGVEQAPEHGWLTFHEGYLASVEGAADRALELARRTTETGRSLRVPDLEMLGLALEGSVLVNRGVVGRGMALLDEAAAAAVAGEAKLPIAGAWTCCFLVTACESVRDYPRAREWCREIEGFARRYGSRYMLGFCRTHYGVVHLSAGRWPEAERCLEEAVEAYSRSRPAFLPAALAALAELRRRQGRWDDAEGLLDRVGWGSGALLCRARLALDRGEALRAAELAERVLRKIAPEESLARLPALELQVWARSERGDVAGAEDALAALREAAGVVGTPLVIAATELAEGRLAAARGDPEVARKLLEDAADRYRAAGAPFEEARARGVLARTLAALGRKDLARREAERARDRLRELGAEGEVRRMDRLLDGLADAPDEVEPLPELTDREREVLILVARGLTNREVAGKLFISEHTVHRHVANILRKLGLPSRAAAASRAAQTGLLDGPAD